MKRTKTLALSGIAGLAALALCASPGFAQDATAVGAGLGIGTGIGTASSNSNSAAGALSGSLSNSKSSVSGSGNSHQSQGQLQGQKQGQGQSQTAATSGTNTNNINSTYPADQTIKNVPNVYAPGLAAAGSEVCLGSISAGGAGAGFGLTVGGTMVDRECQLRLNARTLATLGYAKAAREVMCLDVDVRSAMLAAGTPCAADYAVGGKAVSVYDRAPGPMQKEASMPSLPSSGGHCHQEYQIIGGWYEKCD